MASRTGKGNGEHPTIKAVNDEPIEPKQQWAYRKGARGPVTCVEVLRLGTARPARVRVRFVEDEYEGREDWVPPNRLKVRWKDAAAWQERDRQWNAVRDASADARGTTENDAAGWIFDLLPGHNYARQLCGRNEGALEITDIDALVEDLAIERARVVDDPVVFTAENGSLIVPWRVMHDLAQLIAQKYADHYTAEVTKEEREHEHEIRWGYMSGSTYISPEICAETDKEFRPLRDLVREWCGAEAVARQDELEALRTEVKRLGELVERAIDAVRNNGDEKTARELERDLGIPVEVLRQANRANQRRPGP
ncbi:hypothetical protein SAMN04487905_112187 [Actinopolyspora xinjiangensis]|uniref:Uncharacterized protein n=1 Tax=Actinopolyspora xinjiangensis TaxID=405564 RepID=A0A1H0WJX8_9ACTN|nr:hypothetical protein [Actinopolyspora xinjiangensis]SDP90861.1 hypothetical protein SAMN04487905_112187 [Actinopolyspora xinjiangensis]